MDTRATKNNNPGLVRNIKLPPPRLTLPNIIGYMSVDGSRHYQSDLSQLKFLNTIPHGRLHIDLNHNIDDAVKRTTDENNEKIDLLLRYLLDHKDQLSSIVTKNEITFITYRRTLISVMCNAFTYSAPISLMACLCKNCIYLCSFETPQDVIRRKSRSEQELKYCAWGYKFEQVMLSDLPNTSPKFNKPVIENEEFSIYYHAEIGNHSVLYGAQIDGMLATNNTVSGPPNTNDLQTNLNYLRNNSYLELKTNKEIFNKRHEENFRKFKLLRCWCQCYLAGLKGLLVGFRNDAGIVNRVQWFTTEEIANNLKLGWDPQKALNYLDYFLTYVKKTFEEYIRNNSIQESSGPITLQFDASSNNRIIVTNDIDENHVILPNWYLDAMEK